MPQDPVLGPFKTLVSRHPERPLVASPARSASIGEVDGLAHELADLLRQSGMEPDDLIAVAVPNGPAFLSAFLATRHVGLAALLLDAASPSSDRSTAAEALGARAVLECAVGWPLRSSEIGLARTGATPLRLPGIALVKSTSGSTGAPRGVATSAESVCADDEALAKSMGLVPDERIVAAIPMSHSYGFSSVALPALVRGSLLAVPDDPHPLAPLAVARTINATFFPTVPAYLQGLLRLSSPPPWPDSIRLVITAGAPLAPETAQSFEETYRQPVHVFYGASECGGIAYDREGKAGERGTVGTPVDGVRIELEPLDEYHPTEGVVIVRSASVASHYVPDRDPRLSEGRFRASDRAVWDGGELRLLGRIDDLINVKGKKVDPAEVEKTLAEIPGVDEVAVVGIPSTIPGSQIVRAVVACRSERLSYQDVLRFCRERLAEHKVPRSIVMVRALPRTARGKLDRASLVSVTGEASEGAAFE